MNFDFYVNFPIKSKDDVDNLTEAKGNYEEISDVYSRIKLLNNIFSLSHKKMLKGYAKVGSRNQPSGLKKLIHPTGDYKDYIKKKIEDRKARKSNGNDSSEDRKDRKSNGNDSSEDRKDRKLNGNDSSEDRKDRKLNGNDSSEDRKDRKLNGNDSSEDIVNLKSLGINSSVDISTLPTGSWLIEFPVKLKKPFISKDDVPLYIIENPVRKDKVFGVPFTSAMAWKGNLRWAMMKIHLEPKTNNSEEFAEIRYRHTLLFGTEKGIEDSAKGWAKYLDDLCPDAKETYRAKLKERFDRKEAPALAGMLYFYPTFWDNIDMEVINPHNRKTKTGNNPIYFEVVPAESEGYFRLLYMPLYYLTKPFINNIKEYVLKDLQDVIKGLKAMMLTYGFSAKKSSGYGVIKEDSWANKKINLVINGVTNTFNFDNFEELEVKIKNCWRQDNE